MKLFSLLLLTLISLSAFAQDRDRLVRRIERVSQQIADEVYDSQATNRELAEAFRSIRSAKSIILGTTQPTPRPRPRRGVNALRCVARDNDNAAPYVFARISPDLDIIQLRDFSFQSMNECETTKSSFTRFNRFELSCVARDNDNAAPYLIAKYEDEQFTRITSTTFQSKNGCLNAVNTPYRHNDNAAFCKARDNDNAAPYIIAFLSLTDATITERRSTTYSTMGQCTSLLSR